MSDEKITRTYIDEKGERFVKNLKDNQCIVCELEFDRTDLEYVQLGADLPKEYQRTFYACSNCAVRERLSWYKIQYEKGRETIEEQKATLNLFKTVMMKVETMQKIGEEPYVSSRSYILAHRKGWESLPVDTIQLFQDIFKDFAKEFTDLYSRKASNAEIQAGLKQRTKEAKAESTKSIEQAKIKANSGLKGEYTQDEKKAVLGIMKAYKGRITEEKAYAMIKKMVKNAMETKGE